MENVENTVETTQVEEVKPVEKPQEQGKTFTQEDVDKIVSSRLLRERETFAKTLGIEEYSKDAIEGITNEYKSTKSKNEEYEGKITEISTKFDEELSKTKHDLLKYKHGISEDKFDEAMAVAKTRATKNEIDIDQALSEVVKDYPKFSSVIAKGGMETGNQTTPPDNPYVTEGLQKKYPFLKK